jgi:hypothetical protein
MHMLSRKKHTITLVVSGAKPSPFVKAVDDTSFDVNFIFNNSGDFSIEHPDPSKRLSYHLELFNLLEKKVQAYKPLHDILQTLASTFDSFNPLKLPPVINMLGRFASHFKDQTDQQLFYMQLVSIFNQNQHSIYPLFKEVHPITIAGVKTPIPLRQYMLEVENKVRTRVIQENEELKVAKETRDTKNEPNSKNPPVPIMISPTSLPDARLCDSLRDPFNSSAGVVIVATDFLSTYYIFSCTEFKKLLKEYDRKITLVTPMWPGNEITNVERDLLDALNAPAKLDSLVEMVKDHVDTIIIPKEIPAQDLVPLQKAGKCSVIAKDLSPGSQSSDEFFNAILKTLEIDRESLRVDILKERVDLSEKVTASLKGFQKVF